jgi:hypothetical protein
MIIFRVPSCGERTERSVGWLSPLIALQRRTVSSMVTACFAGAALNASQIAILPLRMVETATPNLFIV